MDIKAYIESGILESYALGTASSQERREVECLSHIYPEIKEELDLICRATELYAKSVAVEPSAGLKDKIMARLDEAGVEAVSENTAKQVPLASVEKPVVRRASLPSYYKWAAAIAILAISGLAYNAYKANTEKERILAASEAREREVAELENTIDKLREIKEDQDMMMTVMKDPANTMVAMNAIPGKDPEFNANIYWNKNTREVYLAVNNLPIPSAGKQYQLWAIVEGKPIDMGVFDMKAGLMQKMKNVDSPQAFAVTLEKSGGSTIPTMDEMYVMGKML